uniref:Glycolipid transfer protein domain-containing protein 2 isoform X1 n=1 Tax=Pogona vitticeps TaxID=103695 RepID=A0A6J0UAZ7_9SAUR
MGAFSWAPPRLCRLLLPLGVFFLFLLYFSSRHLPDLPHSACIWGGRPCPWFGQAPPDKEDEEKIPPRPVSTEMPSYGLTSETPDSPFQEHQFQIQRLISAFKASLTPNEQILLQGYLSGWKELIKFMDALGAAFGLISRETQNKISIMEHHQRGEHGHHYRTVQSMVTFELANGLVGFQFLPEDQPPSGCRTLLRLHRALKWLELFLHKLRTSKKDGDPSQMCAEAYREALAPYHRWWVRQAVALAFLAMPSRQELYRIVSPKGEQKGQAMLLAAIGNLARVYNITQEVYASHGMLELP